MSRSSPAQETLESLIGYYLYVTGNLKLQEQQLVQNTINEHGPL